MPANFNRKELTVNATSIVNGVDLDRLAGTIDAVTANPALARFQFRARNHWIDGGYSRTMIKDFYAAGQEDATRNEPFTVDTDEPTVLLGENRAPNAGEYVLHALAACLTGTIAYHAAARGIALDRLETTIRGDLDLHGFLDLDSNVRPGYEQIQVTIEATGDFDDNQLAELASLTRYSPVRDIVSSPVPVAIELARA
ncbi:MAG: OsmC family protein [Mycobacterium sp.]